MVTRRGDGGVTSKRLRSFQLGLQEAALEQLVFEYGLQGEKEPKGLKLGLLKGLPQRLLEKHGLGCLGLETRKVQKHELQEFALECPFEVSSL
ncbi:hypothetical protein U1Q18_022643, partial [Sarracenia purpurea var. burkii]